MTAKPDETLWCFRFEEHSADGMELADEFLSALELDHSSYFDRETGTLRHTVYATAEEGRREALRRFTEALPDWQAMGLAISATEEFTLRRSEWAEAWKDFFKPIELSERLMIRPGWYHDPLRPGQQLVVLDPGLSFGTGQHPTTFYCLRRIDRLAAGHPGLTMLDAGCGSGILAIAAAKLGYSVVDAFDFDPDAVEVARENAAVNHVEKTVVPIVADAADHPGREGGYDLVCANLLGHLLIAFAPNIIRWVRPGGHLVLAGILANEFDRVAAAYTALGFREIDRETIREWTGGTFLAPQFPR